MRTERIGDCTIYLADCMDVLPTLGKVDAVVTDPPYGIGYNPAGGGKVKKNFDETHILVGDDKPFDPRHLLQYGEHQIIWGGNNYAHLLPATRGWMLWDKKDGLNPNSFSDAEVAWSSIDQPMRLISHQWSGYNKASEKGAERHHPTQKPVAIMEWCMGFLPKTAMSILDPYMGSGTTGVASVKMGKAFIGIELDERYFEIACKRIREAYAQPDMFVEPPKKMEQGVISWI